MKRSIALLLPLAFAACQDLPEPAALNAPEAALSKSAGSVDVIVVLRDDFAPGGFEANQARAAQIAAELGLTPTYTYGAALFGFAAAVPEGRLSGLANDPRVAYVSEDRPVQMVAQSLPTGIDRIDGELSSQVSGNGSGSTDVDVAIIDTGIDIDHPDLNVVGGKNCSSGKSFDDGNGHGTHVAGTVAAKDDGTGVVGVAPGARLYAVRVLDASGSGSFSSVICGVDFVTANAATIEVANMSLGGTGSDPADGTVGNCTTGDALHDAICKSVKAGVTYAVAAGNDAKDAAGFVPAAYDDVITVSALADFDGKEGALGSPTCRTDEDDTFANFSNFGKDVDIIAPGVCINSTWLRGGYNTISGTSMASPHAAGAAALYISTQSSRPSPATVKSALQNAGNLRWKTTTDPDGSADILLNVDVF
jgi:subtilisin